MKTVTVPSSAPALSPPTAALKLMSDERLARWAAKGSQPAFAVIFERHHQALHRYCQSIVGNGHDAADALQNTMLRALRALPGETRTIALKPWLYRIAHNESISLLRARRGHSDLDAAAHVCDPGAESIVESRERLRALTGDLGELTDQQRGALLMRELGGLEFSEVAAALQVNASAAKQSVYEARCALQSLQEGRAMDCDLVRRTLSDGDRRTLRNLKLRGHLRACAGCRDFEAALRHRPAHLAALAPALPLATAASILQGLLGAGAGTGAGHGGGGVLAAVAVGAKSIGGGSLATKVATVAVIAGSAGGAAVTVPALDAPAPNRAAAASAPGAARAAVPRLAAAPRLSSAHATTLEGEAALVAAVKADAGKQAAAGADRGAGDDTRAGTRRRALQTAVDRRIANAGRPAADRPSRAADAAATPASPRGGRRTSDDALAGRTASAAPPPASQQPVAATARLTPAPASPPLPAARPSASPPAPAEPGSTEAAGVTAAAVTAAP